MKGTSLRITLTAALAFPLSGAALAADGHGHAGHAMPAGVEGSVAVR